MGRRLIVVILIAALIAVGTAYLSRMMLQSKPADPTVANAPIAAPVVQNSGTRILVAAIDLPAGTIIQPNGLVWRSWPQDGVDRKLYVVEGEGEIDNFSGDVVRGGVRAGEPLVRSNVIKKGESGFLAAVLMPGKRAVSISVNEVFGVAGFLFPGDNVDLILSHEVQMARNDGVSGTIAHKVSETILRNIRILAVDQRSSDQEALPAVSNAVTLEVTPEEAEQIALATRIGELRLVLRSLSKDAATTEQASATPAADGTIATTEESGMPSFMSALTTPATGEAAKGTDNSKRTFTLDSDLSLLISPPAGAPSSGGAAGAGIGSVSSSKIDIVRGASVTSVDTQNGNVIGAPSGSETGMSAPMP